MTFLPTNESYFNTRQIQSHVLTTQGVYLLFVLEMCSFAAEAWSGGAEIEFNVNQINATKNQLSYNLTLYSVSLSPTVE